MPSLHKRGRRWVVQANELESRPRRSFISKFQAERFRVDIQRAIESRDQAGIDRLLYPKGTESIAELVRLWLLTGSQSRTEKQSKLKKVRLLHALEAMKAGHPTSLSLDKATLYIKACLCRNSNKTVNERISLLRSFGRWLHLTGRVDRDPFALLQRVHYSPTFVRRALSFDEIANVMAAAAIRPIAERRSRGWELTPEFLAKTAAMAAQRQLLVALCCAAGLRVGEARDLRWDRLSLDQRRIEFTPESSKTRRFESAFMPSWLAHRLGMWREQEAERLGGVPGPQTHVIQVGRNPQRQFRADASFVGLDINNPRGRIDLHCLRHSLATRLMEQGADPYLADLALRHAPQGSTRARIYIHGRSETMLQLVESIPNLFEVVSTLVSTPVATGEHMRPRLTEAVKYGDHLKPQGGADLGKVE